MDTDELYVTVDPVRRGDAHGLGSNRPHRGGRGCGLCGGGGRQHRDIGVQQGGAPKEVVVFVTRLPTGGGVLRKASGLAV